MVVAARRNDEYDAVIVGGGIGGVAAARRLLEAGKRVCLLEAQDRWGRPVLLFRNEWKVTQLKDTEEEHGLGLMPCATAPELD